MTFLRSVIGFVVGFVFAAVIAIAVFGVGRRATDEDESPAGSLAMAAYLLAVTSLPAAAGFAAVTCVSKSWRAFPARRVFGIAAACGFLGYAALLTGVTNTAGVIVPFPLGALGTALRLIVPGALLGLLALAAAAAASLRHISDG